MVAGGRREKCLCEFFFVMIIGCSEEEKSVLEGWRDSELEADLWVWVEVTGGGGSSWGLQFSCLTRFFTEARSNPRTKPMHNAALCLTTSSVWDVKENNILWFQRFWNVRSSWFVFMNV